MPPSIYHNFDLLITRSGDDYRAFVVDAPGGDADVTFALPFTADELDFLGDLAGARRGGSGAGAGADGPVPDLKELGSLLHGAVVQGKVAAVLSTSLDRAEEERAGLRVRLRFSEETSELATLPWEILYDPVQARFLALSESSPILRYLSLPRARPTLLVEPPLRLLAILVSPPGYEELNLEREWEVLESSLAGLVDSGKFVVERLAVPTLTALQERLLGEDVHILHFVGHGVFDDDSGAGALLFADETGEAHLVSGETLAQRLHNHRSLRLVYLNACQGALASHLTVFSGVAQTLVQQGVPAAVAMQAEITDEAAIDVSRTFYSALASGYPVDAALTQARVAVAERSAEWAIPVLFSRSPDNRLFDVVEVLPAPDCPYPGMVPFTEKQADVFFGRDKEIGDAIERLRQHPFLTVIGPSGSGKSSLVYAGVIPELRKTKRFGPGEWVVQTMRPSDSRTDDGRAAPMTALRELLQLSHNASNAAAQSLNLQSPTLLFIDQFEETFTLADAGEAQSFLDALNRLIDQPNLYIILTVRADFYPELMACSLWQPIRANRLELTPLGDEELRAAILQPAAQVGVTIDEVLAERLVADAAGESGALPLVQEALVLLWEKVERRHLALAAYTAMAEGNRNGLQVAIDRRATTVYNNLPEAAQPLARRIFLRLVQFGEGRLDTRRQQTVDELRAGGDDTQVFDETLAKLTANRLLTTSGEEGSIRRVDIAHEALIGGWGLLQAWIREKRDAESTRRRLEDAARNWIASDKQGGLLDEYELHGAEEWLKIAVAEELGVSQNLTDLVQASRQSIADRKAEEEAARQRELDQAQRLAQEQRLRADEQAAASEKLRKRALFLVFSLIAALIAFVATVWFFSEARKAQMNAELQLMLSTSRELAAASLNQLTFDPELSLMLAVEAAKTERTSEAENALHRAVQESRTLRTVDVQQPLVAVEYLESRDSYILITVQGQITLLSTTSKDDLISIETEITNATTASLQEGSSLLALGSETGEIEIYDLTNNFQRVAVITAHTGRVSGLAFSPVLEQLASVGFDGRAVIWDISNLNDPAVVNQWKHETTVLNDIAFSPDSKQVVIASDDPILRIWAFDTNSWIELSDHTGLIESVSFSQSGRFVVSGGWDGITRVWDIRDKNLVVSHRDHSGRILNVTFGDADCFVVSASEDSTVKLWRLDNEKEPIALNGHRNAVTAIVALPGCTRLASVDQTGTFREWNIGLTAEVDSFVAHAGAINSLQMNSKGNLLLTSSDDKTVKLWSVDEKGKSRFVKRIGNFSTEVSSALFSKDEGTVITAGGPDNIRFWKLNTEYEEFSLPGDDEWTYVTALSGDGIFLAVGGASGDIDIWNIQTRTLHKTLRGDPRIDMNLRTVWTIAYSPDMQSLAAGYGDGSLTIWNIETETPIARWKDEAAIRSLTFNREGTLLASGGDSSVATLRDVKTGNIIKEFIGHSMLISSVLFHPDGHSLVTASADRTARVWDLETGEEQLILSGHNESLGQIMIDSRSQFLWSTDREGIIRVELLDFDVLLNLASSRITRDWQPSECQKYLYDRSCPNP